MVVKKIFYGIALVLYDNLTTLKFWGFLLSNKNPSVLPSLTQLWKERKKEKNSRV